MKSSTALTGKSYCDDCNHWNNVITAINKLPRVTRYRHALDLTAVLH